jgi:spermidine/putrescine-binding protein
MIGKLNSKEFNNFLFLITRSDIFKDSVFKKLTREEILGMFRTFKLIEISMAAAIGGISTRGIDSVLLVSSKFKGRPFIRKKAGVNIQKFVAKHPDLCRSEPSDDPEENLRRVLILFKAIRKSQQRTASSSS